MISPEAKRQYSKLLNTKGNLDRETCELLFPDLINYVRENVSLIDLITDYGIHLKPLSDDYPDVLLACVGCPECGSDIFVKK